MGFNEKRKTVEYKYEKEGKRRDDFHDESSSKKKLRPSNDDIYNEYEHERRDSNGKYEKRDKNKKEWRSWSHKKNSTHDEQIEDWMSKRGEARKEIRENEEKSDWI